MLAEPPLHLAARAATDAGEVAALPHRRHLPCLGSTDLPLETSVGLIDVSGLQHAGGRLDVLSAQASEVQCRRLLEYSMKQCTWCLNSRSLKLRITNGLFESGKDAMYTIRQSLNTARLRIGARDSRHAMYTVADLSTLSC